MKSVLYVRLPCLKIYPGGLIAIADYVHKNKPEVKQRIIELSLIPPHQRGAYLKEAIQQYRPDVIAFSWRNIQTFSPHDGTPAMEAVIKFDTSNKIMDKLSSVYFASLLIFDFVYQIYKNKSYIALAHKLSPGSKVVVGGTAFSCFPEQLIRELPPGTIGVVGEGETAMLKVIEGKSLEDESVIYREEGKVVRHTGCTFFDLNACTPVDFSYIEEIFPEIRQFGGEQIGIQTKRGCPYNCTFCLYNVIEGQHVRYRRPEVVMQDLTTLVRRFGFKDYFFADSQFISHVSALPLVEELLDRIIAEKLGISWTGFLRIENIKQPLAKKMLDSGISSFDLSFTGSQKIIDRLQLHYTIEDQLDAFRAIKAAGFSNQMVKLYLPLNSPGETPETLLETADTCRRIYDIIGKDNVNIWLFFLAIQSGTKLEKSLIEEGYFHQDYNPLSYNPFAIKKLLYNPPPLGKMIGRSILEAKTLCRDESELGKWTVDVLERKLTTGR